MKIMGWDKIKFGEVNNSMNYPNIIETWKGLCIMNQCMKKRICHDFLRIQW